MGQIMQRLLDGVQVELQAQERELCAHLNTLASWQITAVKESQEQEQGPGKGPKSPEVGLGSLADTLSNDGNVAQKRKRKSDAGWYIYKQRTANCMMLKLRHIQASLGTNA